MAEEKNESSSSQMLFPRKWIGLIVKTNFDNDANIITKFMSFMEESKMPLSHFTKYSWIQFQSLFVPFAKQHDVAKCVVELDEPKEPVQGQATQAFTLQQLISALSAMVDGVGIAVGKALKDDQIRKTMDAISSGKSAARNLFKGVVLNHYGFDSNHIFCMISGEIAGKDKLDAAYIVPASAPVCVTQMLNEEYTEEFDVNYGGNGLILSRQFHEWFDQRKFTIIYNPFDQEYIVKPLHNVTAYLGGKKLKFPFANDQKPQFYYSTKQRRNKPYHRALKFHLSQCLDGLTTKQRQKWGFADTSALAWTNIAELSEKESLLRNDEDLKNDDDDDDDDDDMNIINDQLLQNQNDMSIQSVFRHEADQNNQNKDAEMITINKNGNTTKTQINDIF